MHVPKEKRSKLEGKSVNCIFVGYPSTSKGFKFYDVENDKMFVSCDATLLENDFLHDDPRNSQNLPDLSTVFTEENHDVQNEELENKVATRKSTGKRTAPERFGTITGNWWENEDIDCSIATLDIIEPRTLDEALNGPNASRWKNAADDEYQSLLKNDTWELVDLPPGKNVIGCKWVFKLKKNVDGSISRYKARLVAQGYSQQAGLDYNEVFAPVARYTSIRTVLAIANALDLELHQMDVKTAFLNGELDSEIYMEQPDGYIDKQRPNMVCKLQKSIYGLKQSARCWNLSIDRFLKASGYTQSDADPCIYSKLKDSSLMIIALYVDDILLASNDLNLLEAEKNVLQTKFEMEDQGEASYCLGMTIERERDKKILNINQKSYLESVLKRFGMADSKPVTTSLEQGKKHEKQPDGSEPVRAKEYQAIIGCLTYATVAMRPDLSAAVGALSEFMSNPGPEHWIGVKRILQYIKGTIDYGLKFKASNANNVELQGYSDADWAGDITSRKSTSGYLFQLGGGIISWRSKRQNIVALSSTEAEYISLTLASQKAIWLRRLLSSIGFKQSTAMTLYEDNQGALGLSRNPINHARTKHIDIKYHFIREAVESKEVELTVKALLSPPSLISPPLY